MSFSGVDPNAPTLPAEYDPASPGVVDPPVPIIPWPTPPGGVPTGGIPMPVPHGQNVIDTTETTDTCNTRPFRFGSGAARNRTARFLVHTYTRQAPVPEAAYAPGQFTSAAEGSWGDELEQYEAVPASGQPATPDGYTAECVPCLLIDTNELVYGAGGPILVRRIQLYTLPDDPIDNGYLVSNVVDRNGVVQLAGPLEVRDATTSSPTGVGIYRLANLRAPRVGV